MVPEASSSKLPPCTNIQMCSLKPKSETKPKKGVFFLWNQRENKIDWRICFIKEVQVQFLVI